MMEGGDLLDLPIIDDNGNGNGNGNGNDNDECWLLIVMMKGY